MNQQAYGFALPPVPPGTPLVAPPPQIGQPPEFIAPAQAGFPHPNTVASPDPAYAQAFPAAAPSQQFQAAPPPAPAPAAAPQMSLEDLAAHWVAVDTQLSDSARAWKDYEAAMKGIRDKLETAISSQIPVGTESITLQGRTFKPTYKIRYQTAEGQADVFWSWIKTNNRVDLLDKRISQSGAEALVEQTMAWHAEQVRLGAVDPQAAPVQRFFPPGFEIHRTPTLSVTKAKTSPNLTKE